MTKKENPFKGYKKYEPKGYVADVVVDIVAASAGLDMAIDSVKKGKITDDTREGLRDLISQTYYLCSRKAALGILKDAKLIPEKAEFVDVDIELDFPADTLKGLVIYYKV